jgi:hypothetical protein
MDAALESRSVYQDLLQQTDRETALKKATEEEFVNFVN